jgi:phosphomethylpyrimidine synthase
MKITQDVRDYAAGLNDPGTLSSGTLTQKGVIEDGMAQMSEKFKALGEQVYVDAEKVKESNKAL